MTESETLLNTEIYVNRISMYSGWPTTTDKLDGEYLKEFESTIERVNKKNQEIFVFYVFFLIFVFLLAVAFSLLSFVVLIPLGIIYFLIVKKILNSTAKQNSNLLEMKMNFGVCSDYITVKKIVQTV
jgi:hypothetical protein